MKLFVKSAEFANLNVAFALDEGLANEENAFKVYYAERSPWWMKLHAKGAAGHGSKFIEPSATVLLVKTLERFMEFRESEKLRMDRDSLTLGDVTTTNITILQSGVQLNVVTEDAEAGIDMRVSPSADFAALRRKIYSWLEPGVTLEWVQEFPLSPPTPLTTPYYAVLVDVAKKFGVKLDTAVFPAATDSRFLRLAGIPAFGISAIKETPVLLHDVDEWLAEDTLIAGVLFYKNLVSGLANI